MRPYQTISFILSCFICLSLKANNHKTDNVFEYYFQQARTFTQMYPQEKAYLQFDNTSYYVGDTI